MNIEKINKLYENMMEMETIFNEEPDAVACIMGLRMASSEFRSAFFKVREVLIECKVSSNANNRRPSPSFQKEEESEGITEYHKDGTRVDIPKASKVEKKTKPVEKLDKPYETITIPGIQGRVIICENTKKKKEDPLTDKFDEFILDSYNESSHDDSPKALMPIDEIIRMFSLYANIKLNNKIYTKFRKYLRSIYTADGEQIYLKPKSIDLPNESKLDDTTMIFYQHPKFRYLWCREDGRFFYLLPDGKTIKENEIIKSPRTLYLSVLGGKSNHSARLTALECYMHQIINGRHVSVLNGDKSDLSYGNLSISTMASYKAPNIQYDESDAVAACEYIVAHNKDISNIESDTNYQIGYGFAKSILEKRRFERIANKYF
jgi:hypothetical protein